MVYPGYRQVHKADVKALLVTGRYRKHRDGIAYPKIQIPCQFGSDDQPA